MIFDIIMGTPDTDALKTDFAKKRVKELLSTGSYENVLVLSNNQDYEEMVPNQQIIPLNEESRFISEIQHIGQNVRNNPKHTLVVIDKLSLSEMSNELNHTISGMTKLCHYWRCISIVLVVNSVISPTIRANSDTIYYTELSKQALKALREADCPIVKIASDKMIQRQIDIVYVSYFDIKEAWKNKNMDELVKFSVWHTGIAKELEQMLRNFKYDTSKIESSINENKKESLT